MNTRNILTSITRAGKRHLPSAEMEAILMSAEYERASVSLDARARGGDVFNVRCEAVTHRAFTLASKSIRRMPYR
ncbi:hypothetical protein GCM10025859_50080 [Alicyclobacillus fastidiosus]|nr:hypothetical protein GCM10025859_50080 [Alicyclobacillus fastidiosus]